MEKISAPTQRKILPQKRDCNHNIQGDPFLFHIFKMCQAKVIQSVIRSICSHLNTQLQREKIAVFFTTVDESGKIMQHHIGAEGNISL